MASRSNIGIGPAPRARRTAPGRVARRRSLATLVATALALLSFVATAGAASVGVVGTNVLVRPTERPATATAARMVAAGNEFESFQVVVQADGAALTGVQASIVGTLAAPGGATLPAAAFTVYRVGYADLQGLPSDGDLGGVLGRYPDALIPTVDPVWKEARRAFPVRVAPGENQLVWIDVLVPAGQAAGTYTGASVRVSADGGFVRDVPIELEVMDLDLPSTTTLDGGFDFDSNQACRAHACASIPGGQSALLATYARVGLDNRVSMAKPPNAQPSGPADASYLAHTRPLLRGTAPTRLPGARLRTVTIYQWAKASAGAWRLTAEADGFTDRVRFHCDEVGKHATLWANCRSDWKVANDLWRAKAPAGQPVTDLPLEVTTSIDDVAWARANGFGDVADRIAVLIPVINYVHPKDRPFPGRRAEFAAWNGGTTPGGAPKSLWSYTSCMSMGCSPADGDRHDFWKGWPSYGIDQPASQARAMGWVSYAYDLRGEYYYEMARDLTTAWSGDLWSNDGGNHGDGTLFYPGTVAAIGGVHDTAIETIRLKRIRDGHEDHELLVAATAAADRTRVLAIARTAFDTAFTTDVPQWRIDAARTQLFALAAGATPRTTWSQPVEPAPAAPVAPTSPAPTSTTPTTPTETTPTNPAPAVATTPTSGTPGSTLPAPSTTPPVTTPPRTIRGAQPATSPTRRPGRIVMCGGRRATIIGTARADVLRGTRGPDVIAALGGNDRIIGLGGGDTICTGTGTDAVNTSSGSRRRPDVIVCGAGRDSVTYDRRDRLRGTCERRRRG